MKLRCPHCGGLDYTTSDSRQRVIGWVRIRKCMSCGEKYKTVERVDPKSFETFEAYLEAEPDRRKANIARIEALAKKLNVTLAAE